MKERDRYIDGTCVRSCRAAGPGKNPGTMSFAQSGVDHGIKLDHSTSLSSADY